MITFLKKNFLEKNQIFRKIPVFEKNSDFEKNQIFEKIQNFNFFVGFGQIFEKVLTSEACKPFSRGQKYMT